MKPENRESYFEIMRTSRTLVDTEDGVTSLEHQLHTRIYNSSFCALLFTGLHCDYIEIGNRLSICNGREEYTCPVSVVKQILRDSYEETLSRCLNAPKEEASASFEDVFRVTADMDFDMEKYDFDLPVIKNSFVDVSFSSSEQSDSAPDSEPPSCSFPIAAKKERNAFDISKARRLAILSDDEDDEPFEEPGHIICEEHASSERTPNPALIRFARSDADSVSEESEEFAEETPLLSRSTIQEKKRFRAKWEMTEEESGPASADAESKSKKHFPSFWPFGRNHTNNVAVSANADEPEANSTDFPSRPSLRFQPKAAVTAQEPEPVVLPAEEKPRTRLTAPASLSLRDHSHDSGELFMHRHIVTLKKRLGSDTVGPYRFTFWPTAVPEDQNGSFAEMLVHVIDDTNKKEELAVFDKLLHEKVFRFDGKELKVYGIWNNGRFESHISLCGQTASIFDLVEDIKETAPQSVSDSFLSQFRLEKKGQPKLFVAPFNASNRGEENIPIIGFAEVKGVRHALRRMEGNTLKYTYDGRLKIVTGHFDTGRFTFSVDSDMPRFTG